MRRGKPWPMRTDPEMRRVERRWRSIVVTFFLSASVALPEARAQEESGSSGRDLSREQEGVQKSISNIRARMSSLADKLGDLESKQDEADRLKTAEDMLAKDRVEETLGEAVRLLEGGTATDFLEAVLRQDLAIEKLDSIIRYLEERRFDARDAARRLDALKEARQLASRLAGKQRSLLEKTRSALEGRSDLEELKGLQRELEKLAEMQQGLVDGRSAEEIDPSLGERDEKNLAAAKERARQLAASQERWNQAAARLSSEKVPLSDTEALLKKIDRALELASELSAGARRARSSRDGAQTSPPPRQSGSESKATPAGSDAGAAPRASEGPEDGATKTEGGSEGDQKSDTTPAGERPDGAPETTTSRSGESRPEGPEPRRPDDSARPASGARQPAEPKESLTPVAREFERSVSDAASRSAAVATAAQSELEKARELSQKVSESVAGSDFEATERRAEEARQALLEARERVARQLRAMRERNAADTAGLQQREGLLEKETRGAAQSTRGDAAQSSSASSEKALAQAAQQMDRAAEAMQKATEALAQGDRQGAQQAGQDAAARLREAESTLAEGEQAAGSRSAAERAGDLQKKLARNTAAAREKTERLLEKKLGKKEAPERLEAAREALAGAERAMEDSLQAGERGESSLAKKKQEEALEHLERASESVDEDERDQLARLERRKTLQKEAEEQDELAALTRRGAQQLSRDAAGQEQTSGRQQGQQLQEAARDMDEASRSLERDDPARAEEEQQSALEKLEDVAEELKEEEERLARLKREAQMTNLLDELATLKSGEEDILRETITVDAKRTPRESRRQRLRLQKQLEKLSASQGQLAAKAQGLQEQLESESAHVFSFVLKNVVADMKQTQENLDDLNTADYTQFLEREIIRDLDRLILAIEDELERSRQQQREGQQPPGQQPPGQQGERLVSMMAELLMLKDLQVAVNRKTSELEDLRQASAENGPTEAWQRALERLSQKQGSVGHMLEAVIREFEAAAQGPPGAEGEQNEAEE